MAKLKRIRMKRRDYKNYQLTMKRRRNVFVRGNREDRLSWEINESPARKEDLGKSFNKLIKNLLSSWTEFRWLQAQLDLSGERFPPFPMDKNTLLPLHTVPKKWDTLVILLILRKALLPRYGTRVSRKRFHVRGYNAVVFLLDIA